MALSSTDKHYIHDFLSGKSLPYNKYTPENLEQISLYKKNNLGAVMVVLDGIKEYAYDSDTPTLAEAISLLVDEVCSFALNGLFGIGYWGISVEDGMPIRVDSLGRNISKRYDSVYENMTAEEYAHLDRIESMILDQRENRKFNRYLFWYKDRIFQTLVPVITLMNSPRYPEFVRYLEQDDVFKLILRHASHSRNFLTAPAPTITLTDALSFSHVLEKELAPWKELLDDDEVSLPQPITPTEIITPIKSILPKP